MTIRNLMATTRRLVVLAFALNGSLNAQYVVDTYAGTASIGDGGLATNALFRETTAVIRDASGGYYVADIGQNVVRYVNPDGIISTVAGIPYNYGFGASGQKATLTSITDPSAMAVDPQGNLYIAEYSGCVVRKVDRQGNQTVVVGQVGRCAFGAASGPGTQVLLAYPTDLSMDAQGRLLIVDRFGSRIRRLDASGNVTTVAGGATVAFAATNRADGIAATSAQLAGVYSVTAAPDGSFYYSETGTRNRVRRVDPAGIVTTIAGGSTANGGNAGDGGPATLATFSGDIRGVAIDAVRNKLYIIDRSKHRVRVVDLGTGIISHFAGQANTTLGGYAGDGGPAATASLNFPILLQVESDGSVLIADRSNHVVRKVSPSGMISTLAGRRRSIADSTARQAEISDAADAAFDSAGNAYIVDRGNKVIRRITPQGQTTSIASDLFTDLKGIGIDATGRIFVLDAGKLLLIVNNQVESLFTMDLTIGGFIPAPARMAMDPRRNRIFFSIPSRHQISVMNLAANPPSVSSFAGNGTAGFAGDGGQAQSARLNSPRDMAVDVEGNIYVADTGNHRLRRINAAGVIETVAGIGSALSEQEFVGFTAKVSPTSVAMDKSGIVIFTDTESVRSFDPATKAVSTIAAGLRYTVLGSAAIGSVFRGDSGNGGDSLSSPVVANWVRSDGAGNHYFGTNDNRVRYLRPYEVTNLEIVSGDNQAAEVQKALAAPLVARATTNLGLIENLPIRFNVASGPAVVSSPAGWWNLTDNTGQVRVTIQMGAAAGEAQIRAESGAKSAVFRARALAVGASVNRPAIAAQGGVITAAAFGASTTIAPGSWIEIYGTKLSTTSRAWKDTDFTGAKAPVELDGVRVTVAGRNAFVAYVSPTQINAQVPDDIGSGPVDVIVSTATNGPSDPVRVTAAVAAPGLLAPSSFKIGGIQHAVAIHADGAFVGRPDLIAGAAFRPAKPGDVLVLYGVGFGDTSPRVAAGSLVANASPLAGVSISFGDQPAQVLFAGLASGAIGLYQFNVVVPTGSGAGDVPLRIRLSGAAVNQNLSLTLEE